MLFKSGRGSKSRLLQTAFQFHGRMAEEEERNYEIQLGGRRFSIYCKKIFLPMLFPQMSLITTRRRLKRISTHVIVTSKIQDILQFLLSAFHVTSTLTRRA